MGAREEYPGAARCRVTEVSLSLLRRVRWGRALGVWLLIALVESVHGVLRQTFVAPHLGPGQTRTLGFVVGAALVLAVAVWTQPWLAASTRRAQLGVGVLWLGLMLAFELLLGRAQGLTWQRIWAEFEPSQGARCCSVCCCSRRWSQPGCAGRRCRFSCCRACT